MSERAVRLGEYLENEFGWNVFETSDKCPKCKHNNFDNKYCGECGTKLPQKKDRKNEAVVELEEAIKYALKKDTKKKS